MDTLTIITAADTPRTEHPTSLWKGHGIGMGISLFFVKLHTGFYTRVYFLSTLIVFHVKPSGRSFVKESKSIETKSK